LLVKNVSARRLKNEKKVDVAQGEFHSAAQARARADGDSDADHGFAFDGVGRPAH
jgi:hypothetical protein